MLQLLISIMALLAIVAGGLYLVMGVRGIGLVGVKMSIDPTMPPWHSITWIILFHKRSPASCSRRD